MSNTQKNSSLKNVQRGSFYIISGPSGVGKNTIIRHLLRGDSSLRFIISLTTRQRRSKESPGNPYEFVSKAEFMNRIEKDELLEWQLINGNFYGSSKKNIERELESGRDIITDLEVLGVHEAVLKLPTDVCTVFIAPPEQDELVRRITMRHKEDPKEIDLRMIRGEFELSLMSLFDYSICNDELKAAVQDLASIITAHRSQKILKQYMSKQGQPFLIRTISFTLLKDPSHDDFPQIPADSIELPKTKLGPLETKEVALRRLLSVLSFRASVQLNPYSYFVMWKQEHISSHHRPLPFVECNEQCYVSTASKRDLEKLIEAGKLISKLNRAQNKRDLAY